MDRTPPSAAEPHDELIRDFGLAKATALNMSNMIGIGPFITMNLILGAMGGPQAILGWIVGVLLAICDGMVWSELSAAMPGSGGSYLYLRECFGRERWGRLMAFMFIWQFMLSGPLEIASGAIGLSKYAAYPLVHYGWIDAGHAPVIAEESAGETSEAATKGRRGVRQLVDEQAPGRAGDRFWRVGAGRHSPVSTDHGHWPADPRSMGLHAVHRALHDRQRTAEF